MAGFELKLLSQHGLPHIASAHYPKWIWERGDICRVPISFLSGLGRWESGDLEPLEGASFFWGGRGGGRARMGGADGPGGNIGEAAQLLTPYGR